MKLIREEVENVEVITEGKGSAKRMYIEGTFLQGDIKNRNGRMYPIATLAKEVGRYNEAYTTKVEHLENSVIPMVQLSTLTVYHIKL